MKEVFEKIIEKLEECEDIMLSPKDYDCFGEECKYNDCMVCAFAKAIEIVKQEAEKYNNGWIPCDDRLPDNDRYILLSFDNFSVPCVGRYEEDENGGAFYIGDEDETCISQYLFVNAWMPLPEPYKEGERHE